MSRKDDVIKRDTIKNKIKLPLQFGISVLTLRLKLPEMYKVDQGRVQKIRDLNTACCQS